jgi:P pilus assembly chaperone PapD
MWMRFRSLPLLVLATAAVGLAVTALPGRAAAPGAAGDLLVAPTRLVLEGRTRTAALSITNTGSAQATYRISFVRRRMTANGEFLNVETPAPGEHFADELVRFSPRQVDLAPGTTQTVRLQLRKPAELKDGEYRSHLLFRAVPVGEPPAEGGSAGLNVQLTAVYGISVPVIVRQGQTAATLSISDLAVAAGETPTLSLLLNRQGTRSVFGELSVAYAPPTGAETPVALARGVAVYTPNENRLVRLPLQLPAGAVPGKGTLRVRFTEPAEVPDRVTAQADLPLP